AAAKALEIDESSAEAHAALGALKNRYERDWLGAEKEFKRSLELNPGIATTHQWYSILLVSQKRFDEGIQESQIAGAGDPLSQVVTPVASQALLYSRRTDEAIAQARNALELDPSFWLTWLDLGEAYEQKGMYEEAVHALEKAAEVGARNGITLGDL